MTEITIGVHPYSTRKTCNPSPFKVSRYSGKDEVMPEENGKHWNGEGLPPVGTNSEAFSARTATFRQCTVLAHRNGMAVVSFLDQEELQWATEFRSADKAAADARDSAINLMIGHVKDHPGGRHGAPHLTQLKIQEEACRDLYDAGYRKEVTP